MPRKRQLMSAGLPANAADAIGGQAQTVTLAGSTAADAAKITGAVVVIGTSSAGGAILPPSDAGDSFLIKNEGGNTMTLYPPTGATINTTTSLSVATAKSIIIFFTSATACHSIPTVAS